MYERPSFSVPGSAGSASYCAEHGHTLPDQRGKCLRCSARVTVAGYVSAINREANTVDVTWPTDEKPSGVPCA